MERVRPAVPALSPWKAACTPPRTGRRSAPVLAPAGCPSQRAIANRIDLRPAAVRALKKLDPPIRRRIQGAITLLAEDPRLPARPLRGRPGLRAHVGDYRIVYTVADDILLFPVGTYL